MAPRPRRMRHDHTHYTGRAAGNSSPMSPPQALHPKMSRTAGSDCAIHPPLLCLATSIPRSRLAVIVKMRDSGLIEKDRLAGGPILRREYQERTTFVVSAKADSIYLVVPRMSLRISTPHPMPTIATASENAAANRAVSVAKSIGDEGSASGSEIADLYQLQAIAPKTGVDRRQGRASGWPAPCRRHS
jgi:hypothetical protein